MRGFQFVANLAVKPDFVIISTFNEFHENSHIEPSIYYQDLYANLTKIAILNLQKQWAFKQEACAEMC
ncbi:MAG: hypothetical protein NTU49_05880 [Gammaproteobacteria bacterium]|nr:hypothetical protein [Gammaproteobacteria bacterium]